MRAIFVRHGQSTGNAGVVCNDLALIELTELGWQQARNIAEDWTEQPNLIVISPYLRTQQTAVPTIRLFPDVSVEVWPVQEFTYLEPSRWNGTLSSERMPHIVRYWQEADTAFCDGEGSESFGSLLGRAQGALNRLELLSPESLVYVFSHGQFIQAVLSLVVDFDLPDREKMRKFWKQGEPPAIGNCQLVELEWTADQRWREAVSCHNMAAEQQRRDLQV